MLPIFYCRSFSILILIKTCLYNDKHLLIIFTAANLGVWYKPWWLHIRKRIPKSDGSSKDVLTVQMNYTVSHMLVSCVVSIFLFIWKAVCSKLVKNITEIPNDLNNLDIVTFYCSFLVAFVLSLSYGTLKTWWTDILENACYMFIHVTVTGLLLLLWASYTTPMCCLLPA